MATIQWPERSKATDRSARDNLNSLWNGLTSAILGINAQRWLGKATWAVILAGIAVLATLSLRVWLQLTGDTAQGGLVGLVYDISGILVSPFASFEPKTTVKSTGILEFSSLVAIEAYLIITLLALTVLLSARITLAAGWALAHHHQRAKARKSSFTPLPERPQL